MTDVPKRQRTCIYAKHFQHLVRLQNTSRPTLLGTSFIANFVNIEWYEFRKSVNLRTYERISSGMYTVWVKNPPLRFSDIFSKRLRIFNQLFYTPIIRYYLR